MNWVECEGVLVSEKATQEKVLLKRFKGVAGFWYRPASGTHSVSHAAKDELLGDAVPCFLGFFGLANGPHDMHSKTKESSLSSPICLPDGHSLSVQDK